MPTQYVAIHHHVGHGIDQSNVVINQPLYLYRWGIDQNWHARDAGEASTTNTSSASQRLDDSGRPIA
ncbi:hypothetical protein OH492_00500 [Vibrio chagasii]|nr:hypothetical protein [Vibrio chagasii]